MLDIDGVPAPDGISPVCRRPKRLIEKPSCHRKFQDVTRFYQFSGSAGIRSLTVRHRSRVFVCIFLYACRWGMDILLADISPSLHR